MKNEMFDLDYICQLRFHNYSATLEHDDDNYLLKLFNKIPYTPESVFEIVIKDESAGMIGDFDAFALSHEILSTFVDAEVSGQIFFDLIGEVADDYNAKVCCMTEVKDNEVVEYYCNDTENCSCYDTGDEEYFNFLEQCGYVCNDDLEYEFDLVEEGKTEPFSTLKVHRDHLHLIIEAGIISILEKSLKQDNDKTDEVNQHTHDKLVHFILFKCDGCDTINYAVYEEEYEDSLEKYCELCGRYYKKVCRIPSDDILKHKTINIRDFLGG